MVLLLSYSEDQQKLVFAHELCVPASDATALAPDGPLAGSAFMGAYTWASWFWRFMVRQTGVLTPEEAVRRLSGLARRQSWACPIAVCSSRACAPTSRVFDPETFADTGTTFEPNQLAAGMRHVVVNGTVTLRDGALTGERGGAVLRKRA